MFKRRNVAAAAAATTTLCSLSLLTTGASGGIVSPGETVVVGADGRPRPTPTGAILARSVLPFSIAYRADDGDGGSFLDFGGTATGTLTNTVLRESSTGTLTFVYDIDYGDDSAVDASEASVLTVSGFDGFSTDVTGLLDFEPVILASRSADGADVRLGSDDPGLGGAPTLVVRTDATAFARTGTARFFAGDELAVLGPDGPALEFAGGTAVVLGAFEPADSDPPPPTAIPLPPAAWSGLAGIGAVWASRGLARRRQRRRDPR
jgi:hypothetical protein